MSTADTPHTPGRPGAPTGDPWAATTDPTAGAGPGGGTGSGDSDTKEQVRQVAGTGKEEGKHVAGVAKGEAQDVAGTARDEAQNVLDESRRQAKGLLEDARSQLEEQSRSQRDRLVSTLSTFGDDLEKMARGESSEGMAQDLARQLAHRARDLSSRMDGREPTELLEEVRSFARRRPGTFLLGALAAGVVAGRLTSGAKEAQKQPSPGGGPALPRQGADPYGGPRGTATGDPLAGTGAPDPTAPAHGTTAGSTAGAADTGIGRSPRPVQEPTGEPPVVDPALPEESRRGGAL